jgi:hypothetical protein
MNAAAVTIQRAARGRLARLRTQRRRQQMLIKVAWCKNCDRAEPGGDRCKFCGRKLVTMDKLPHELRSLDMADKTFTHYGACVHACVCVRVCVRVCLQPLIA